VLDSQVAGRWRRTVGRDGVIVEVTALTPFDTEQHRALGAEVDRLGAFHGRPARRAMTVR
jgi:hypothetical protein